MDWMYSVWEGVCFAWGWLYQAASSYGWAGWVLAVLAIVGTFRQTWESLDRGMRYTGLALKVVGRVLAWWWRPSREGTAVLAELQRTALTMPTQQTDEPGTWRVKGGDVTVVCLEGRDPCGKPLESWVVWMDGDDYTGCLTARDLRLIQAVVRPVKASADRATAYKTGVDLQARKDLLVEQLARKKPTTETVALPVVAPAKPATV